MRTAWIALVALAMPLSAQAGLINVSQSGTNLDPIAPQIEPTPLGEESFAYVDRTHELTAARFNPATNLLDEPNTGTLVAFPSYLQGAQYVANANDNRSAGVAANPADTGYTVTYTTDTPGTAYLLLDNRLNGTADNGTSSPNDDDPDLGGNLVWVTRDGWQRVNTGIMPNGQADYVGFDEGATVASPDLRTHHDPGPGEGLNQFFAIYSKQFPAGTFQTFGQRQTTNAGNMYVVAFQPIPEPATVGLLGVGLTGLALRRRRHA
jgi:hypothetical protein